MSKLGRRPVIGFRPTREFLDRLQNYMAIHQLDDKSEAMRKICKEWGDQKKELETLRTYIKDKIPPSPQATTTIEKCPKLGVKFKTPQEQQDRCTRCKSTDPSAYIACQELKEEKD